MHLRINKAMQRSGFATPLIRHTSGELSVKRSLPPPGLHAEAEPLAQGIARLGHAFGQLRVHPARAHAHLELDSPGDILDQEADRIADQVAAAPARPGVVDTPLRIQRSAAPSNAEPTAGTPGVHRVLASPGTSLEPTLRQDMERRFGHDFSRVRVHTDPAAAQSAQEVNARAYTVGHDIVFGEGRFAPRSYEGQRLLAHELTHVLQQHGGVAATTHSLPISPSYERVARFPLTSPPSRSAEPRTPKQPNAPAAQIEPADTPYPDAVGHLAAFLLRSGYIEKLSTLIPPAWRSMSQAELTTYLSQRFTPEQLTEMFLKTYEERNAVKATFRRGNVIAAFVVGLIWARENLAEGQWREGLQKIGETTLAAYVMNRLLYARDPAAAEIMNKAPAVFGRWFQGAARGNKVVNFIARDLNRGLLLWDLKDYLMSGGGDGPNIPGDIIIVIDIDDPSTWREPEQILLDLGFDLWYRQKETPLRPRANVYLGKIEGSRLKGLARLGYALAKAALPFNEETVNKMADEQARRDWEHFKELNPDATQADYDRMQQQIENFETWGIP